MFKLILILLLVISSVCTSSEDYITAYTNTNLVNNISVFGDEILLSTEGGFVKYDLLADTIRVYHKFNSPIPIQDIRKVVKDSENSYWVIPNVTSPAYLYRLKNDEWSIYTEKNFAPLSCGNFVDHISIDRDGKIWILLYPYLRRISGDTFDKSYYLPDFGFKSDNIYSMEIDRDNSIWLLTRLYDVIYDVFKISTDTVSFRLSSTEMLKGRELQSLVIDSLNNVWISSDSGITKYDGKNFTDYNKNNSIIVGAKHKNISAGEKYIWMLGFDSIIYKFDISKEKWFAINYKQEPLAGVGHLASYKDKAIFSHQNTGLEIADTSVVFLRSLRSFPGYPSFGNLIIDTKNRIIGWSGGYFTVVNPDFSIEYMDLFQFGIVFEYSSICIDSSGMIWVVDDDSLIRLNQDLKVDSSIKAPHAKSNFIKIIAIDDKKVCLLSRNQLFIFNGTDWQEEALPEIEFPETELRDISIDKDNNPVVLETYGIFTKKHGIWEHLSLKKTLPQPYVDLYLEKILPDNKGGYYILSKSTGNLFYLIDSTLTYIKSRTIYNICMDNYGKLFIMGRSGVFSYDGYKKKNVINYEVRTGSAFIDYQNNLWISCNEGLIKIKLDAQLPDNFIKAVKMNAIVNNPESGKYDREIESTDIYDLMPSKANYDMLYPVGYFKNDTKDRYLNFKVRAYAFDKNKPASYYEVDKNIDSVSLAGDPNITMLDSSGNTIPFNKEHGLPPGMTARVVFPEFKPPQMSDNLSGDIVMNIYSMNYNLDDKKPFPLEDVTDDSVAKKIALVEIVYELDFEKSFDTLTIQGQGPKLIINPKAWSGTGGGVYMEDRLNDNATGHIKVSYNDDNSITLTNDPYPLLKLGRKAFNSDNNDPGKPGGEMLISPIIDFRNHFNSILNIEFSRNIFPSGDVTNRGFSKYQLIGPERRVISPDNNYNEINKPDKLIFEFIYANENNLAKLLNPLEEDWTTYKNRYGETVKGIPALEIYGGGGYSTAFYERDKDSLLNDSSGLRANIYDLGFDSHYQRILLPIPDFVIKNGGYFRLRVRVDAKNDAGEATFPDDNDDFYIKNIKSIIPCECGDLGITEVKFDTPYSVFPKDHNVKIPIKIRIRNYYESDFGSFWIQLVVKNLRDSSFDDINIKNGYFKEIQINSVGAFQEKLIDFPPLEINNKYFNQMNGTLKVFARLIVPGGDIFLGNDSIISILQINKGDAFAYDNYHAASDVDKEFEIYGRGLNMYAYSSPDYNAMFATGDGEVSTGTQGGNIAVKFDLAEEDTVFGFCTFWESRSSALDDISYSIYKDDNGLPGELIDGSIMYKNRLYDDIKKDYFFEQYVRSLYDKPLILQRGTYWAAVTQMGETGFELGGSGYRMGMVTTVYDRNKGIAGKSMFINKYLTDEYIDSNGKSIISNKPLFAYQNFSGPWIPFSPNTGNPAYGYLNHSGTFYFNNDSVNTYIRGTWAPMLRVFMDGQYYKPNDVKDEISNNISISPNPASDFIEIRFADVIPSEAKNLKIYNSLGECVKVVRTPPSVLRLDISPLPPGIYFVRIGCENQKFIKY